MLMWLQHAGWSLWLIARANIRMSSPLLLPSNLVSEFNQKAAGIGVLEMKVLDFQPPAIQERSWEARSGVEKHKPYKIIIWEWGWGRHIGHLGREKKACHHCLREWEYDWTWWMWYNCLSVLRNTRISEHDYNVRPLSMTVCSPATE